MIASARLKSTEVVYEDTGLEEVIFVLGKNRIVAYIQDGMVIIRASSSTQAPVLVIHPLSSNTIALEAI